MSYRPITDTWYCVRPKLLGGVRYYGAYPAGFLERARSLMGVHITDPVLHVCGGYAHLYPYYGGYGDNDARMDLNAATKPEYLCDVRDPKNYPSRNGREFVQVFKAMIADPPYSKPDATFYPPGSSVYPLPRLILRNMLLAVDEGCRVAVLHYVAPRPPNDIPVRFVAKISVSLGYDNRDRVFSVYEKLPAKKLKRLIMPTVSLFS